MKTALITGASSGIGRKLCEEFARHDHNLVLVARRKELLEEIKKELEDKYGIDVYCFPYDLNNDVKAVYDYCRIKNITIDVLINNAGYGDFGIFIDSDIKKALGMIDLNDKALVALTYHFIQDMKERGTGHIINVGSVASFVPGPYMAVYYATKSFVMSFSLALREELKKDNIKVSLLCPAPTRSPFWQVANGETTAAYDNVFARMPEDAARTCYRMYERNQSYAIDGLAYKISIFFMRHFPLTISAGLIGFVQRKTKKKN